MTAPGVEIRPLTPEDAPEYRALRLRGLGEAPEAFGSTHAEEVGRPMTVMAERLGPTPDGTPRVTLGAYVGEHGARVLVGVVTCVQAARPKERHKAALFGMYVAPEARGRGIGRALVDRAVAEARGWPGVARIVLTVVERATAARALYRAAGFRPFGLEPDAFRQDGVSDAVELMTLDLRADRLDHPG